MKFFPRLLWRTLSLCVLGAVAGYVHGQSALRRHINLDKNWKFHLGNAADPTKDFNYGSANLFAKVKKQSQTPVDEDFADSDWQSVQLPHDWVVTLPVTYSANEDQLSHGYRPVGGLYPANSIGWYRRKFDVPSSDSGRQFSLSFDGVYRDSKVWVNGIYLGGDFSGYLGRSYDITDLLYFNKPNTITVRVDATQYEGWFYEGAGINRHVWLDETDNIHVNGHRYFAFSKIRQDKASVLVDIPLRNDGYKNQDNITIVSELRTRDGKSIAATPAVHLSPLPPKSDTVIEQQLAVIHPRLWDIVDPYLYRVISTVYVNGVARDSYTIKFGIRDIRITADSGLLLNGKRVKIKGTNNHQDYCGVGTALPDALQYYRIRLLKAVGSNAVRTSHAAPAPELLDACDSLGMLVLDEQRLMNSSSEYKEQLDRLIERDRNHPSVFLWSVGNEENGVQTTTVGKRMAQDLVAEQHKLDPTRTSTYAADLGNVFGGVNEVIPVRGFNYRVDFVAAYHHDHPSQPVLGTEMGSTVMTRGIYKTDTARAYIVDQDSIYPWWAGTAEHWWKLTADKAWMMGGFVWTGFDYRGEPTPFEWPNVSSHFGMMDLCGFPKNIYYYYKSWWSDQPVLHIGQQWNRLGDEGKPVLVWVYGNTEDVELFLNGKSLGKKAMPRYGHLEWEVPYHSGTLLAVGYKNGKKTEDRIVTTGPAMHVTMKSNVEALRANGTDVAVINLYATDEAGNVVPDASDELHFELEGSGKILGFGNGDPSDHSLETTMTSAGSKKLFNGMAQILVRSGERPDTLTLKVQYKGKDNILQIPQK